MEPTLFKHHEKRQFDREQLYYYLKVYQGQKLAGYLGDISNQGLMLFTTRVIKKDVAFELRIELDKDFGLGDNLVFNVKSLWSKKDSNPDYYVVGFKYVDIDQDRIDKIQYLINKYGSENV